MAKVLGEIIRSKFEKYKDNPTKKVMVAVSDLMEWADVADGFQKEQRDQKGQGLLATVAIEEWRVKAEQFQHAFENERKILNDARSIIETQNTEIARLHDEMDVDVLRVVSDAKKLVDVAFGNYSNPRVTNVTSIDLVNLLKNLQNLLSITK